MGTVATFPGPQPQQLSSYNLVGVLGLMLLDPEFRDEYFPLLQPSHFAHGDRHLVVIAEAFWKFHELYHTFPSPYALVDAIIDQKGKALGIFLTEPSDAEIDEIKDVLLLVLNPQHLHERDYHIANTVRILRFLSIHRTVLKNRQAFITGDLDTDTFVQEISEASSIATPVTVGVNLLEDLDSRTQERSSSATTPGLVHFSVPILQEKLEEGGLPPGSIAFWMAAPNGGKSSALIHTAKEAAIVDYYNVLFITAELSQAQIIKRFDASITNVPVSMVRKEAHRVEAEYLEKARLREIASRIQVVEVPMGDCKVSEIETMLDRLAKKHFVPQVVVIDYADHLRPSVQFKGDNFRHSITSIWTELKKLAQERKIVIWTASQMNDAGVAASEDAKKTLNMRHMDESRAKIKLADFAVGIARTQREKDKGTARLVLLKNRHGSGDGTVVRIFPDFSRAQFFTGRAEWVDNVNVEEPIEGFDAGVAADASVNAAGGDGLTEAAKKFMDALDEDPL